MKLTENFISGLEAHEWRDEVQDEVDEQIRLNVLRLQLLNRCSLQEGTYSALNAIWDDILEADSAAADAASLTRYALGLPVDRD